MRKFGIVIIALSALALTCGCKKAEVEKTPVNITVNDSKTEEKKEEKTEEKAEEKELDAKQLADALKNEITYKDELTEMDLDTAKMFIGLDGIDIEEGYIYESSGATAEEIVVLKCKDEGNAKKAANTLETRVNDQIASYESYVPEEVVKLNKAVVVQLGNIAALSVSDDDSKAKEILKK